MITLVFISLLVFTLGDPVPFEDCGFIYQLHQVDVAGCSSSPCNLLLGSTNNVTMRFTATQLAHTLQDSVLFSVLLIDYPAANVSPEKACDSLVGASCPLQPQMLVDHWAEVVVNPSLAPTRGKMEWKLLDEQNREVICFRVSIQFVEI